MKPELIQILLVDDNEDDVVMIQEAFEQEQLVNIFQVVYDGEEALKSLRREGEFRDAARPGLILLDINMPRKNGFEVLVEIRNDPALQDIPVVMLTTSDREEDILRSYKDGACSFISKPLQFSEFKEIAHKFSLYWALVSKIPKVPA